MSVVVNGVEASIVHIPAVDDVAHAPAEVPVVQLAELRKLLLLTMDVVMDTVSPAPKPVTQIIAGLHVGIDVGKVEEDI